MAVESKLAGENVSECILERDQPTKNSLKAELVEMGLTPAEAAKEVTGKILMDAVNERKKNNVKALKILLKYITLLLFSTINNKQLHDVWKTLAEHFKDSSPSTVIDIFDKAIHTRMTDPFDPVKYINVFEAALDKITNIREEGSHLMTEAIEVQLQYYMRKNLSPKYNPWLALDSQWSEEAVNLRKMGTEIINYSKGLMKPLVKAIVT